MKKSRHDDIHVTPDMSHVQNPDVAHEESDVNVKAILQFVGGLLIFGVIVCVLMLLLYKFFEGREMKAEQQSNPGPMAFKPGAERLPPAPRLQVAPGFGVEVDRTSPVKAEELEEIGHYDEKTHGVNLELNKPQAEMEVLRAVWHAQLEQGTIDSRTGARVGLPIEEAIRKIVEQPPPARAVKPEQAGAAHGEQVPSYESAGRMMEKRDQ